MARQVPATAGPWRAKRGTLSDILTSIVAKHQKTEAGPFGERFFRMQKKLKGGTLNSRPYCMFRGKAFLVQFARRNASI